MTSFDTPPTAERFFSFKRVLVLLLPLVVIVACFAVYQTILAEPSREGERSALSKLGLDKPRHNRLDSRFNDANGDLLADAPVDLKDQVDPNPLVFSFVGGKDPEREQQVWGEFLNALASATGRKVEYLVLESPDKQLAALREGKLHIAGINTGNVPAAVNTCGFIPAFTFGMENGSAGYTSQIIVRPSSTIEKVPDLRDKKLALTERQSNSGYKVPLVLLMNDFNLYPQRDFECVFTYGHEESIHGIASGEYEAAAVASDMLARAIARFEIKPEQFRVIYESERFPPAALGYIYNLKPEIAEKVRETFSTFKWAGTGLEEEFGPGNATAFVPVNYKDGWSLIRRIDDAMSSLTWRNKDDKAGLVTPARRRCWLVYSAALNQTLPEFIASHCRSYGASMLPIPWHINHSILTAHQ